MSRLRQQAGFTIVELMVAMLVGMVVIFASYELIDAAGPLASATQERVDATQRGRAALEDVVSALRSEVCLSGSTPPIVSGTDDEVVFYSNMGDQDTLPQKRRLHVSGGALMEDVWQGTGTPDVVQFGATPTLTRTLLDPIARVPNTPVFRYLAFNPNPPHDADDQLPTSLSTGDAARVAQVDVSFVARTPGATTARARDLTFEASAFLRTADPTQPEKGAACL